MRSRGEKARPDNGLWRRIVAVLPTRRPPRLPFACGKVGGVTVRLVDGNAVKLRRRKDPKTSHVGAADFMDFVEGGNGLEDPELCGRDEVYVDARLDPACWPFVAYHELTERKAMVGGASYARAHDAANRQEKALRLRAARGLSHAGR